MEDQIQHDSQNLGYSFPSEMMG